MDVSCTACQHQTRLTFCLPIHQLVAAKVAPPGAVAQINPTDEPSEIIDVAGWVTIFSLIAKSAADESDKIESRKLGYEAAQCLEEAIKFYEEGNDLPPENAFFSKMLKPIRVASSLSDIYPRR